MPLPDAPMETAFDKDRLRAAARARRAALSADERAVLSARAARHLTALLADRRAEAIALYWPIRDEIDCRAVLTQMHDEGSAVALPVVMGANQPLVFRVWRKGAALVAGGFGTLAPPEDAEMVVPDIVVLPLLGFDGTGTRLGYGQGHYDRTIAGFRTKPLLIGFAFGVQELAHLPRDAHDVPLDMVVTEAGIREFS